MKTLSIVKAALFGRIALALAAALTLALAARAQAPAIVDPPRALNVGPGDSAGFAVTATGAAPLAYQWSVGGTAIVGATGDVLLLPNAQATQSGDYTVTVTNAEGSATSAAAHLAVTPYTTQWVDPTFATNPTEPATVFPLSDGTFLAAEVGYESRVSLVHLLADGSSDSTTVTSFMLALGGDALVHWAWARQPDGKVLVTMTRSSTLIFPTPPVNLLQRVNADGSLDDSFAPPDVSQITPQVLIATGGKILIVLAGKLVRLNADGSIDGTFHSLLASAPGGGTLPVTAATLDASGRILAGGAGYLWRLKADGSRDPTFPLVPLSGTATKLVVTADGSIVAGSTTSVPLPVPPPNNLITYHLTRILGSGVADPEFRPFAVELESPASTWPDFVVQPDGKVLLVGGFVLRVATDEPGRDWVRQRLARLLADGSLDPTFAPPFPSAPYLYTYEGRWWPSLDGSRVLLATLAGLQQNNLITLGPIDPPRILRATPASATVDAGDDLAVSVVAVGPGPWRVSGKGAATTTWQDGILTFHDVQGAPEVVVDGPGGEAMQSVGADFAPSAPRFRPPLESTTARPGEFALFETSVSGTEPMTVQWFKDGEPVAGQGAPENGRVSYGRTAVTTADAGNYSVQVTNSAGTTESSATLTIGPASELANLSVRGLVGTGDNVMIVGTILKEEKRVLFQAVGPELVLAGVPAALADPRAALHEADGTLLINDDVGAPPLGLDSSFYSRLGVAPLAVGTSKSSELIGFLPSGGNTIVVEGVGGTTGVALAQIFDAENSTNRMRNLSARVYAGTGDAVPIVGFVIRGDAPRTVLIRCVGPGLTAYHVPNVLADPRLTLVAMATHATIATNDDWGTADNLADLRTATQTVGAFALADGSKDAAMLITLAPGAYSAVTDGAGGTTGVVLLEVYDVP